MPKFSSRSKRIGRVASITNRPSGGGNSKSGLGPSIGRFSLWNGLGRTSSTPEQRAKVFCINQIGGVGRDGNHQTRAPSDGITACTIFKNNNNNVVNFPGKWVPPADRPAALRAGLDPDAVELADRGCTWDQLLQWFQLGPAGAGAAAAIARVECLVKAQAGGYADSSAPLLLGDGSISDLALPTNEKDGEFLCNGGYSLEEWGASVYAISKLYPDWAWPCYIYRAPTKPGQPEGDEEQVLEPFIIRPPEDNSRYVGDIDRKLDRNGRLLDGVECFVDGIRYNVPYNYPARWGTRIYTGTAAPVGGTRDISSDDLVGVFSKFAEDDQGRLDASTNLGKFDDAWRICGSITPAILEWQNKFCGTCSSFSINPSTSATPRSGLRWQDPTILVTGGGPVVKAGVVNRCKDAGTGFVEPPDDVADRNCLQCP